MSVKSRHQRDIQCPNPRKLGEYCGVHSRAKNVLRIDAAIDPNRDPKTLINVSLKKRGENGSCSNLSSLCDSNQSEDESSNSQFSEPEEIKASEYYDNLVYLQKVVGNQLYFDKLLKTLRHLKIQIAGSAENMRLELIKFYQCQELINQAYENTNLCNNTTDFCAFEELKDIPCDYLFIFLCGDGLLYGLDIRSLHMYVNELDQEGKLMDRPVEYINPYNRLPLSSYAIYHFRERLAELQKQNKPIKHPDTQQGPEDAVYFQTLKVFHQIYNQGFPVEANWFLNLSTLDLYDLYAVLEDIWNRRLNLTAAQKRRVAPDNENLFSQEEFQNLKESNHGKLAMQQILINKVEKLVSSAEERDDRNTGIFYFLLGLKEVVDIGEVLPF